LVVEFRGGGFIIEEQKSSSGYGSCFGFSGEKKKEKKKKQKEKKM
jgi:hypothetical protein